MTTYTLPPGAWLSGMLPADGRSPSVPGSAPAAAALGAGWWPEVRRGSPFSAGLWPEVRRGAPVSAMLWPEVQPGAQANAGLWPDVRAGASDAAAWWPDKGRRGAPTGTPWWPEPHPSAGAAAPWQGVAPDWVYASGAEALLARALQTVHNRIVQPIDPRRPKALGPQTPATDDALWRWQRPYRVAAVQAEILGRMVVQKREVWWVPAPSKSMRAQCSFSLMLADNLNRDLQVDKVLRAAVEREERLPEILAQAGDIGVFFDAITGIDRSQAPRLAELLEVAWNVTTLVLMALKNSVAEWRPVQRSAQVMPVIATPGHGALPSGHAAMATVASELLSSLLYPARSERRMQLDRLARRIAFNRVVAGVHFPMDSAAGYALGRQLAALLAATARNEELPQPLTHLVTDDSELHEIPLDDSPAALVKAALRAAQAAAEPAVKKPPAAASMTPERGTPLLELLWSAAAHEVAQLRV